MIYMVSKPSKELKGTIGLRGSKSEHNRMLIINALSEKECIPDNPSLAKDTKLLAYVISHDRRLRDPDSKEQVYDIGHAGTAMRFLTALFASTPGTRTLTGSARMKQRPVGVLVDALRGLGATIEYLENEGFPPLMITGKKLSGGSLEVDGSISSQYITALLLIAPTLAGGLKLKLKGSVTSVPYIRMTLALMERCGITYSWEKEMISIPEQKYKPEDPCRIEGDWSSASYYYSMAALAGNADITLKWLEKDSLQGDSIVAALYRAFGVRTEFTDMGVRLTKGGEITKDFAYDFTNCPDIAQTVAVTAAALGIPARLTGLHTLKIKETDRITALQTELKKFGVITSATDDSLTIAPCAQLKFPDEPVSTYNDHRMAMAFVPLALLNAISIEDMSVVDKSYPAFWDDLHSLDFEIDALSK
jgi:3-phosphoshikimate 1-carboxyvinyltransferase